MLEESFSDGHSGEGQVVKGIITAIEKDMAIIDVGLKVEGRVAAEGIRRQGQGRPRSRSATKVEVYVERIENALGEAVLSRDKARREESWVKLEEKFDKGERVEGVIFNQVKGGFTVDLDGAVAFLPRSQVDIRPIRDVTPLMHMPQPFEILKMDRRRGNIVVSRRTVLEESRAEQRSEIVQNLEEGQVVDGVVKNITDYGAFVDLGGIDGLLHVTDMAWRRVNHPTEILNIGQTVKVQIIRINQETHRISLGMKQLESDPWDDIGAKYPDRQEDHRHGHQHHRLRRVRRAGAGHRRPDPRLGNVLDQEERPPRQDPVDHPGSRRDGARGRSGQAPHLARPQADARESVGSLRQRSHPVGSVVEGEVKNKTEFGLFIGLDGDVDGMVHLSDLDWSRPGEQVIEEYQQGRHGQGRGARRRRREGAHLARHQAARRAMPAARPPTSGELRKNAVVTCEVTGINDGGLEVRLVDQRPRDRSSSAPTCRATATSSVPSASRSARRSTPASSPSTRSPQGSVSIKALEIAEEKEAVAQYGSSDSGASLGDILGAALKKPGS